MSVITLITLFPAHSPQNSVGKLKEISETFSPPTVSDLKGENMQKMSDQHFHDIKPFFPYFSLKTNEVNIFPVGWLYNDTPGFTESLAPPPAGILITQFWVN